MKTQKLLEGFSHSEAQDVEGESQRKVLRIELEAWSQEANHPPCLKSFEV